MKQISFAFLLTILVCSVPAQTTKSLVLLTGTVRNFNNQVEVEDMSELKDLLLPDTERFFVPDAEGHFRIQFSLTAPNYFRIGRNIVYLSPGDSLIMLVDYKDPKLATFSGKHSKENEYLRETPFPKGGSFLDAGGEIRSTLDSTVMAVELAGQKRTQSLQGYTGLSKEFVQLETARIRADILNSFTDIRIYFPYMRKLSKDSADAFHKNFVQQMAPYMDRYNKNFIDPAFLKLAVYRNVIDELPAGNKDNDKQLQQVKDWITARNLAQEIKKASDRESKLKLGTQVNAITSQPYKAALQNTMEKVLQLSNGDPAVEFTAIDNAGAAKKLTSQKGKLIYIDIWATWCGPCLEEMPAYEKLKASYKDNPNISFISLSIDDDKDAWKQNMKKRDAQGFQWIIDRAKLSAYNIIGIPRSILVNQNFAIVEMNAALPSSKTITQKLDELLK
ncbi:MAG: TlpA disulfide reductase family protein [Bacteroidota bacterium]